jgi:branched-chain amino acid transport system ATP-binding protein
MLLNIEQIKVQYKDIVALHDVSLSIEEGQIVAVLGANGSGKSTLLKSIASLLKLSQGRILFNNESIGNIGAHNVVHRGISLVPEGKHIFAKMSVKENLLLGAFTQKDQTVREEALGEIYDLFPRLKERLDQKAGTLSGGEQQMLAIGRGLMSRPKLLMFDEPSLGIAPNLVPRIFEVIDEIRQRGVTVLLVEQHVQEAMEIADRAYILQTGNVALEGKAKDLLNSDLVKKTYLGM